MRSLIRITDYDKLLISTPIDTTARRVVQRGVHNAPVPEEELPMISLDDIALFRSAFRLQEIVRDSRRTRGFQRRPRRR